MSIRLIILRSCFSGIFGFSLNVLALEHTVGTLPANFSVNQGAVSYSVPIDVVPGRAGMQPELSLHYSSSGGDGVLGLGLGLGGLSVISRCAATVAQDGFKGTIGFDEHDRYCLDGQRLTPVRGNHGEVGAEYRTEIDVYSQIISYGGSDNHPETFVVKTKAGQVITYGGLGNASNGFPQGTMHWAIRAINDTTGNNPIVYHYVIDENTQYLDSIRYPGGRVGIVYENRPDPVATYYLGNAIVGTKRIDRIEAYVGETNLGKYYQISYDDEGFGQQSIVSNISVCDRDSACLRGINFISSHVDIDVEPLSSIAGLETQIGPSQNSSASSSGSQYVSSSRHFGRTSLLGQPFRSNQDRIVATKNNDIARIQSGDFNGDGLTDIYYIRGRGEQQRDTIHLSTLEGGYQVIDGIDSFVSSNENYKRAKVDISRLKFADFNADGLTDIYRVNGSGSTEQDTIYLSNGDGTYQPIAGIDSSVSSDIDHALVSTSRINFGDFNGDGLLDIYRIKGLGNDHVDGYVSAGSGDRGRPGTEVVEADEIHLSNGDGTYQRIDGIVTSVSSNAAAASRDIARIKFADFNADGRTDIYYVMGYGEIRADVIYLSLGDGNFTVIDGPTTKIGGTVASAARDISRVKFGDFNGDGLTDIYAVNGLDASTTQSIIGAVVDTITGSDGDSFDTFVDTVYLARGDGTYTERTGLTSYVGTGATKAAVDIARLKLLDYNGDGITDIYYVRGADSREVDTIFLFQRDGQIQTIDGLNSQVGSLSDDAEYASMDLARFSFGDFNGDGYVDIYHIQGGESSTAAANTPVEDQLYLNRQQRPLLTTINDAYGNSTVIHYAPLTRPSVYNKGADAVYPVVDRQFPQYVVSAVEAADGIGGWNQVSYHYEGFKVDIRGRGSLGFRQITEYHHSQGKETITTFDQRNFPYTGGVLSVEERFNGERINYATSRYDAIETYPGVYQVSNVSSEEISYELSAPSVPVVKVTTYNSEIDRYGNSGRIEVHTRSGNSAAPFIKTTLSQYANNASQWHLGRLIETRVVHQSPDSDTDERITRFAYDSVTGLLNSQSIVGAATGTVLTETTSTYNDYGQVTRKETTAQDADATRFTTYTYDDSGRLLSTCNSVNECETKTYNAYGQLSASTGPNGLTTRWDYDGLGRLTQERRADGTSTSTQLFFTNSGECGELAAFAHTCSIVQISGKPPVIQQKDTLGRTVRAIKVGFDGRNIYSDTEYGPTGLIARVSRDYYEGDQVYWATSEYDALDRVIRVTEPGPNSETTEVVTQYDGLRSTVFSGPNARAKTTTTNAIGQTIRIDEVDTYIEYSYTSDNNLQTTTVNGDARTTIAISYDEFGRKVAMYDPAMGHWQYRYDAFGQLVSQTDAKGQTSAVEYDALGRMIRRVEPEGITTWVYGDNTAPSGSIGKLLQEKQSGFTKDYRYDGLGRLTHTTSRISDRGSFTTQTSYDALGRVSRTRYPGNQGFYTENVYNAQGFLAAVIGDRRQAEPHDYSALQPLIQAGIDLADEYLAQAQELRRLGQFYQVQLGVYQSLAGSGELTPELHSQLAQHQANLSSIVGDNPALSPELLVHINNTVLELEAVTALINTQAQDYETLAEQLVVLVEQTLATADRNFQLVTTLDSAAEAYDDLLGEADSNTITYWQAVDVDASGRISAEVYGNGIVNDYTYNQATGHLQSIHSSLLVFEALRHLEYQYDAYQNVTLRHDWVNDIRETFNYDEMDRLTATHVSSSLYDMSVFNGTQTQQYDAVGNITDKSDVGDYEYGAGVNVLTRAGGNTYTYDANGNMLSGGGRTIEYSSFNKPVYITQSGRSVTFSYGPDRARFKKVNHQGDATLYLGLYEETTKTSGVLEQKHYIYAAGQLVAEHIVSSEEGALTRYLHKDALSSVDLVTDSAGNVVDRRSFDAWGNLRDLPWQEQASFEDPLYLTQLPFTNKAYTGHENVQEVDLIHMNGRMYDATLARFISPDPHIQADSMSQNYNRYSYVLNNPMKYNDPSGYFFEKLFDSVSRFLHTALPQIIPTLITAGACTIGTPVACGAVVAATTYTLTGDISAAIRSGFTSLATAHLSGAIKSANLKTFRAAVNHGMVGGAMSVIQGGKFGQGFASSFFTKMLSGDIEQIADGNRFAGAVSAMLVAGTASVLGGGKFANGAQTAMIQYLYNQVMTEAQAKRLPVYQEAAQAALDEAYASGDLSGSHTFETPDELAIHVLKVITPITEQYPVELGGTIYKSWLGYYKYDTIVVGGYDYVYTVPTRWWGTIGSFHTHPDRNYSILAGGMMNFTGFSESDLNVLQSENWIGYLGEAYRPNIRRCDASCSIAPHSPAYGETIGSRW